MGGDLLGKAIIPIERADGDEYRAEFLGDQRLVHEGTELDELVDAIRFNGFYPWIATSDEIAARVGGAVAFGLLWYLGAKLVRQQEGIDIDRVYAEIPPE